MANEAETKRWNDERWVAAWLKRERLTEAVTPHLVKAIDPRPGQRFCDIGCGGGGLTIALAGSVAPDGEGIGVDLSAALLELARSRAAAAGATATRFVEADVQTGTLEGAPFDLAVSQFGIMFFDEPTAAFAAIRVPSFRADGSSSSAGRVSRRTHGTAGTALRPLLPPPPVPAPGKSPVGAFALGDNEYVGELLEGAGFGAITSTPHETTVRAPASAVADRSLLPLMGVPPEREAEAAALLEEHLGRFAVGPDLYEFPLAFQVFEAINDRA